MKKKTKKRNITLSLVATRFWQSPALFRKVDFLNGGVIAAVLAGVHIANPRRYPHYEKANIKNAYDLVQYSLLVNDEKDLSRFALGSPDAEIRKDYESLVSKSRKLKAELLKRNNMHINSFIEEINIFEDWVLSQKQEYWDLAHTKKAREIMNIINTACTYALLIGLPDIGTKVTKQQLKINPLGALEHKYAFALAMNPQTDDENAITILWSLAMLTQTYDDQTDRVVDSMCRLNTFATVLYRYHLQNISKAVFANKKHQTIDDLVNQKVDRSLHALRKEYIDKAKQCGYGPVNMHDNFFNSILLFLKSFVLFHTHLPRFLRNRFASNITSLREKWIVKGKFKQI